VLTKDQHKLNRRNLVIVALIWLGLGVVGYRVGAQGTCSEENTPPPDSLGQSRAWAQNAVVTVNFDANTISQEDYDCLKGVLQNFNGMSGFQSGNGSGVCLSFTRSANAVAHRNADGTTSNSAGVANGLQINGLHSTELAGSTLSGTNGTTRTSAVITLGDNFTSCEAKQMNFAHEIAHTFGLDHCPGGVCGSAGASVMNVVPYNGPNYDGSNISYGRLTFSACDAARMKEVGHYTSVTLQPPPCDSSNLPEDNGGGGGGGGGGGNCTSGWDYVPVGMGGCVDIFRVGWLDCGAGGTWYGDPEYWDTTCDDFED